MAPKTRSGLRLAVSLTAAALVFACWTASLYLPHGTFGQRATQATVGAVLLYSTLQTYRRRRQRAGS